jgi:hypothetical protein
MEDVAGLVAQAIADNFAKEGPGWAPLKGATIRNSVGLNRATKALLKDAYMYGARKVGAIRTVKKGKDKGKQILDRRELKGQKRTFYEHVDKYIEKIERSARSGASEDGGDALGNRQILRRTSLMFQTVTTPGFSGSAKRTQYGGTVTGSNIRRVEGSNLIWGTNLIYAATHNNGTQEPRVPKREFLVIRDVWQARLTRFVFKVMTDIVRDHVEGNA